MGPEIGRKEIPGPSPASGKSWCTIQRTFAGWRFGSEATPRLLSINPDRKGKEVRVTGKEAEELVLESYGQAVVGG